jgi:uncharacterized membrane protein YeiH
MMDELVHGLDLIGVAVFVISGAQKESHQRMDVFGLSLTTYGKER